MSYLDFFQNAAIFFLIISLYFNMKMHQLNRDQIQRTGEEILKIYTYLIKRAGGDK